MQHPLVLHSHHVARQHLQADVVLLTVQQIIKGSHGLEQIIHFLQINIQMSVARKMTPVDSVQLTSCIVTGN